MINKLLRLRISLGIIALSIFIGFTSCQPKAEVKPKYVFLFIGDGMGANQVYSTEIYKAAIYGQEQGRLSFTDFPVQSYCSTYSLSNPITCSAAAGTALATGFKTKNGVISKDSACTTSYTTIAEKAKQAGFKVGILTSVYINHATPAVFYAHQDSRKQYYEIAMQLAGSNFDYFAGGDIHNPKGTNGDQPDAIEYTISKGYRYVKTVDEFNQLKKGDDKILAVNPNNYPDGEMYYGIDSIKNKISLAQFTAKGIELLDNEKGFFMMVEGGKIDWACHNNDVATSIGEVMAFDSAVNVALNFYKQHPDQTLIIVTADHETGGMATGNNYKAYDMNIALLQNQKISVEEFSKKIQQLASQPKLFSFDQLLLLTQHYFGFGDPNGKNPLTDKEKALLQQAYQRDFIDKVPVDEEKANYNMNGDINVAGQVVAILDYRAGIGWTAKAHTAIPVPVRVLGCGQEHFKTYIDNTDIPKTIEQLMGLATAKP